MRSMNKLFRKYDLLLLILAAGLVLLYVQSAGGGFPLDDSWIHQTYGRNLAQTGEWAFIPGQPSAASTSPLYTVLLATGYVLNVPYTLWAHVLGFVALLATGMIGARMAETLLPDQRLNPAVVGSVLVAAWHLIWAAASGMETMVFSLLTLVLIGLAWRERDRPMGDSSVAILWRGVMFGSFAALTTLARPEGLGLAGLVGLTMLAVRPQGMRGLVVWSAGAGLGFAIIISPYLLLNYQITGGFLPDTAAAKQAQAAELVAALSLPQRIVRMLTPLTAGGQTLLLPGALFYLWVTVRAVQRDRRRAFDLLPLAWAAALILLYAARLPADYQHGRYVIPSLPAFIVAGMTGTFWLLHQVRHLMLGRVVMRALLVSSMVVFVYFALLGGRAAYVNDVRLIDEEMVTAAHWIDGNLAPDDLLAIHDIGAVGFFAPRPLLDIAGLVTPEVIPMLGDADALWDLMQTREARHLMAFPDQVPGGDTTDPRLCLLYTTGNPTAVALGGHNMSVYELAWDEVC